LDTVLQRADNCGLPASENMVEVSGLRFYLK